MSEIIQNFEEKGDFDNESFYYYLPNYNPEKKKLIGEKIIKFKGVRIYALILNHAPI
jgi:hypothetical protein